jgi:hypothetical protein
MRFFLLFILFASHPIAKLSNESFANELPVRVTANSTRRFCNGDPPELLISRDARNACRVTTNFWFSFTTTCAQSPFNLHLKTKQKQKQNNKSHFFCVQLEPIQKKTYSPLETCK